jgi:hypothetical protein
LPGLIALVLLRRPLMELSDREADKAAA